MGRVAADSTYPDFREAGTAAWRNNDRVIVSLHSATREPNRSAIMERRWDVVIFDEAHHLRNRTTEAWKFASEIQKQFCRVRRTLRTVRANR